MKEALFTRNRGKTRFLLQRQAQAIVLAVVVMLLAFAAGGAYAAAPVAGTAIGNQAIATYDDPVAGPKSVTSNSVTTYVQQVASLTLVAAQTKTVSVGGTVYFLHTVTNTGNGSDTFTLAAAKTGGALNLTSVGVFADTGSGAGAALSPAQTASLAPGASFTFYVGVTASTTALPTDTATVGVTATSTFGATPPAVTITDTVNVSPYAILNVSKFVSPGAGNPLDTVTYTIHYTNTGNANATNFVVTDLIPAGMTYVAGSGRWTGTGATALTDLDNGDAQGTAPNTIVYDFGVTAGNTVKAVINQVLPGQSGDLTFQVTVNAGLGPQTITNTAGYTYSDGSGGADKSGTAPVDFTVSRIVAVVLDDVTSTTDSDGANDTVTVASAPQGGVVWFDNVVHNNGNDTDSFTMTLSGAGFPGGTTLQLFDAAKSAPLSGGLTPAMAAGGTYHVFVKATLPMGISGNNGGAGWTVTLTATSVADNTKSNATTDKLATINAAAVDITNDNPVATAVAGDGLGVQPTGEVSAVRNPSINPGASATFTLKINNTGSTDETFIMASAPDNTFSSGLPAGWSVALNLDGGAGNCSTLGGALVGNTTAIIPGGQNVTVCAVVSAPANAAGGLVQNVFFKATGSNTGALDVIHDAVTINTIHNITVAPNNTGQIFANGTKVYIHTVTNNGNVTEGAALGLATFVAADNKAGWTSTLYYDTNSSGGLDAGDSTFADLNTIAPAGLAPGGTVTIFVKVQSPAVTVGDQNTTTITVTYDSGSKTATATDTTTMIAAQLTIDKFQALDAACDGTADGAYVQTDLSTGAIPGACIRYRIVVTNGGTQQANNLTVTDNLTPNTLYNTGANCYPAATDGSAGASATVNGAPLAPANISAPAFCASTGAITYTIGTLPAGQAAEMLFGVQITQ